MASLNFEITTDLWELAGGSRCTAPGRSERSPRPTRRGAGHGPAHEASSRNEAAVGTWGTFPRAAVGMIGPVSVLNDDSARER